MLVYDVSDARSFSTLPAWLTAINEARDPDQTPPKIVLVGNKGPPPFARFVRPVILSTFSKMHVVLVSLLIRFLISDIARQVRHRSPSTTMTAGLKFILTVDLEHLRAVKNEEHLSFARRNCIMQALVSAKTGDSVSSEI